MTEHAAVIFVFFFLAEYGSILLMCILSSILFIGGYLTMFNLYSILDYIGIYISSLEPMINYQSNNIINSSLNGLFYSLNLGIKSSILVFIFI
jgi:NADH-ubiquinone oxidoreductase chain 1